MKWRPRKFLRTVVVFLLLGAIVNVAVAWGIHIHVFNATQRVLRTRVVATTWAIPCEGRPNRPSTLSGRADDDIKIDMRFPVRAGWPCLALEAFMFERVGGRLVPTSGMWKNGIRVPAHVLGMVGDPIQLPARLIYPGFAINTIFYAAVLGMLFFGPGRVRRSIRRQRGLCPACAYPIGTSPVCTECGGPVRTCAS